MTGHTAVPFQVTLDKRGRITPARPELCEPHVEPGRPDDYLGSSEWAERMIRTWDQRQCRGCGLWAVWERRAITANLPDGSVVHGPAEVFIGTSPGNMRHLGYADGWVERP